MMTHGILYSLEKLGVDVSCLDMPEPTPKSIIREICEANGLVYYDTGQSFCLPSDAEVVVMYHNPADPDVDLVFFAEMSEVYIPDVTGLITKRS